MRGTRKCGYSDNKWGIEPGCLDHCQDGRQVIDDPSPVSRHDRHVIVTGLQSWRSVFKHEITVIFMIKQDAL